MALLKRLFVAAWIPATAREASRRILEALRSSGADMKWVEPENLHVTIRFLGDTNEDHISRIERAVTEATRHVAPFPYGLGSLGAFGSHDVPRVVWAGIVPGEEEIVRLASRVDANLVEASLVPVESRPFRAHVTLGRSRSDRPNARLSALLDELAFEAPPARLEEVCLVESRLTAHGSQYHERQRFPLGGKQGSPNTSNTEGETV